MTPGSTAVHGARMQVLKPHHPGRQLALLAGAAMLAMTLWFSATAVLPALRALWNLTPGQAAWLTAAVQLGFVIGALTAAFFNLPDVLPPRRMFAVAALAGAAVNLALAWWVHAPGPALVLRFCTGFCLAGVYPPGMKMAAGHVEPRRRGLAIGLRVGALTLGSATPHLLAAWAGGAELPHRLVLTASSVLAVLGALLVAGFAVDGPYLSRPVGFDIRQVGRVLHNRPMVLANLGYLGHMWELYAMWAWLAIFLAAALPGRDAATPRLLAFVCIGIAGSCGAIGGGWLADRIGRTTVAIGAMVISGACCLLSAAAFGAPLWILGVFCLVWGMSVIADSAQFSACVTELADPAYMGTALTLQTSLGFALTLVSIWTLPQLAARAGWQFAFWMLAPGPLLGSLAMASLRRDPAAMQCASGRL
jgi:MFS family permease